MVASGPTSGRQAEASESGRTRNLPEAQLPSTDFQAPHTRIARFSQDNV